MPTDRIHLHLLHQGDRLGFSSATHADETLVVVDAGEHSALACSDLDGATYIVHRDGRVEPREDFGDQGMPAPDRVTFGSIKPYGPEAVFGEDA